MADIFYQGFEDRNADRNYPFSDSAVLVDTSGFGIGNDVFVDAVLYPESGECRLESITGSDGSLSIVVAAGDARFSGTLSGDSKYIDLYDEEGIHRGTVVVGRGAESLLGDPTVHRFANAPFCSSVQFNLSVGCVNALKVGDDSLTGDVTFESDTGRTSVVAKTRVVSAGTSELRFDVVQNPALTNESGIGVRSIYIVRKPKSFFNVIDRNGQPYLFLSKNGTMSRRSLIDRDKICSNVTGAAANNDSIEKSYTDDCGGSSVSQSGTDCEYCGIIPDSVDTAVKLGSFLRLVDKANIASNYDSRYDYHGFYDIPCDNDYSQHCSMRPMFIEGTITVRFFAFRGFVDAYLVYTHTKDTDILFYGRKFSDTPSEYTKWISLSLDSYKQFYDYYVSNRNGNLGYQSLEDVYNTCKRNGWLHDVTDTTDRSVVEKKLKADGLVGNKPLHLYTIIAKDYFKHFGAVNWVESTAEFFGDELRYLVGWGDGTDAFSGGADIIHINGTDTETGERRTAGIQKWIVARYIWWKKYSRSGSAIKHFVVPKGRGITMYTGDFYVDDTHINKECSPVSWKCPALMTEPSQVSLVISRSSYGTRAFDGALLGALSFNVFNESDSAKMRANLYKEYDSSYDPTYELMTFKCREGDPSGGEWQGMGPGTWHKFEVEIDNAEIARLDTELKKEHNRVTADSLVLQPLYDAPVFVPSGYRKIVCVAALGPFEYQFGKTYVAGIGYTDELPEEAVEEEEAKYPVSFRFDITKNNKQAFNIDTTDMVASGLVYKNPVHISANDSTQVPPSIDVDAASDLSSIESEFGKLTKRSTSGNGIEISIPGLQR